MNRDMIQKYNSVIEPNDTVLWVGDCFFKNMNEAKQIMDELNGHKLLVRGNHDRGTGSMAALGFDLVMDECFMKIAGRTCRVKHYPYLDAEPEECHKDDRYKDRRPPKVPGEVLIHGHNHAKYKRYNNMIHVGVDAHNFSPCLYSEVEKLVSEV